MKVTVTTQLAAGARDAVQVLVCANAAALVPVRAMLPIIRVSVPVFFNVTDCAALVAPMFVEPSASEAGVSETDGAPTPIPLMARDWGEPVALSVTLIVPLRAPPKDGEKTLLTWRQSGAGTKISGHRKFGYVAGRNRRDHQIGAAGVGHAKVLQRAQSAYGL